MAARLMRAGQEELMVSTSAQGGEITRLHPSDGSCAFVEGEWDNDGTVEDFGWYVDHRDLRPHVPRKQPKRDVKEEEKAADSVTKPEHYMWIPIECKDVVKHFSCMVGQAIQYQWRHMYKGRPVEDLEKAVECLKVEIARLKLLPNIQKPDTIK